MLKRNVIGNEMFLQWNVTDKCNQLFLKMVQIDRKHRWMQTVILIFNGNVPLPLLLYYHSIAANNSLFEFSLDDFKVESMGPAEWRMVVILIIGLVCSAKWTMPERWKRTSKIRLKIHLLYLHAFCIVDCRNCFPLRAMKIILFFRTGQFSLFVSIHFSKTSYIFAFDSKIQIELRCMVLILFFFICVIYRKHTSLTIDYIKWTYFNKKSMHLRFV